MQLQAAQFTFDDPDLDLVGVGGDPGRPRRRVPPVLAGSGIGALVGVALEAQPRPPLAVLAGADLDRTLLLSLPGHRRHLGGAGVGGLRPTFAHPSVGQRVKAVFDDGLRQGSPSPPHRWRREWNVIAARRALTTSRGAVREGVRDMCLGRNVSVP